MGDSPEFVAECLKQLRGPDRQLVEIFLQHRRPATAGFLAALLEDPDPETWKGSLDVLVAIGPSALKALREARDRLGSGERSR